MVFNVCSSHWPLSPLLFILTHSLPLQNAGCGAPPVAIDALPLSAFDKVMSVNVRAAFIITQHAVRQMKSQSPQGGRIINNGSISAHVPRMSECEIVVWQQ